MKCELYCMCESHLDQNTHMHILYQQVPITYPKKKKKVKYFWIYETLKIIVFMFYCKDVKYDMCELKKKNHTKNKICKEFDDLTFHYTSEWCLMTDCSCTQRAGQRSMFTVMFY